MVSEDLHLYVYELGESINFTLSDSVTLDTDSNGNPLKGIFDNAYSSPDMGYMIVVTNNPTLTCVWEDVSEVKKGHSVVVNNETYKVISNLPDGTGLAVINLG